MQQRRAARTAAEPHRHVLTVGVTGEELKQLDRQARRPHFARQGAFGVACASHGGSLGWLSLLPGATSPLAWAAPA